MSRFVRPNRSDCMPSLSEGLERRVRTKRGGRFLGLACLLAPLGLAALACTSPPKEKRSGFSVALDVELRLAHLTNASASDGVRIFDGQWYRLADEVLAGSQDIFEVGVVMAPENGDLRGQCLVQLVMNPDTLKEREAETQNGGTLALLSGGEILAVVVLATPIGDRALISGRTCEEADSIVASMRAE